MNKQKMLIIATRTWRKNIEFERLDDESSSSFSSSTILSFGPNSLYVSLIICNLVHFLPELLFMSSLDSSPA